MERLKRLAAAGLLLSVLFLLPSDKARGQGTGVYRVRQERRVGRVTLPTPPFNPNAGILGTRKGREQVPPKNTRRRATRRGDKASKQNPSPGTARRRRVRRGRNQHPGTPRGPFSQHR